MAKRVASKSARAPKAVRESPKIKQPLRNSAAKRATAAAKPARGVAPQLPAPLYYRLNTFLHTLRVVAGYEDQLCTLLHALRHEGAPNPALLQELRSLLDEIPSADFAAELDASRAILPGGRIKPTEARGGAVKESTIAPATRPSKKAVSAR